MIDSTSSFQEKSSKKQKDISQLDPTRIPRHIGVIMDGNGRWAKKRGLQRSSGHEAGATAIENLLDPIKELGIDVISLYSFSKENWSRPKEEIQFLWKLLVKFFTEKLSKIQKNNVRVLHSGDLSELPMAVRAVIKKVVKATSANTGPALNFCINYGGRQEIVNAVRAWIMDQEKAGKGEIRANDFTEKSIEKHLYTAKLPKLDLVIRTSGEERISNFLIWQMAYSEIWITEKLWPDFSREDLIQAIWDYQSRNRRFGGI